MPLGPLIYYADWPLPVFLGWWPIKDKFLSYFKENIIILLNVKKERDDAEAKSSK